MAISAVFTANFDRLEQAVNKAVVSVKSFETGAKNAARDVSRLAESFSGAKIQAEAARTVKAVEAIGGASKLTDSEMRRVNATVTDAIAKYRALGEQAPASLEKLARETTKVEQSSVGLTKTLGAMATVVGTAAGSAVNFAVEFNTSMANVATLIPGNVDRVNELKGSVQDLAVTTGKSTADLSEGLYQVISAFGDTADSTKILETNAKAAAAGMATTTEAINLTSAVTKGYGDTSAEAVQKASDLAFVAVKLGQTSFPELASSIGRVVPLTAELGVKQEELFGVMATFTGVTGKAADVSTQLRGVMQALLAPSEDMTALFGELGVESGKALIQQQGLQGAITTVVNAAKATNTPLQKYLGSIEAQTLALAATGAQSDTFTQKLAEMTKASGATDEAFRTQTEGINKAKFQYEQFKQVVITTMQQAGDAILNSLPGPLGAAAVGASELGSQAFSMAGQIAQVAIAAKLLAGGQGLGALLGPLATTARLTRDVEVASIAAAGAQGTFAAATTTLMGRLALFAKTWAIPIAAIGTFAAGLKGMGDVSDDVRHPLARFGTSLTNLVGITDKTRTSTEQVSGAVDVLAKLQAAGLKPMAAHETAVERQVKAQNTLANQLRASQEALRGLTGAQRAEIDAGLKLSRSTEDIAKAAGTTASVVELYKDRLADATKHTKELTKATQEAEKFQKSMADSVFDTAKRIQEIEKKRLDDAMDGAERGVKAALDALDAKTKAEESAARIARELTLGELQLKLDAIVREGDARKEMIDATFEIGRQARTAIDKEITASLEAVLLKSEEFQSVMFALGAALPGTFGALGMALGEIPKGLENAETKAVDFNEALGGLAQAFVQLDQVRPLEGWIQDVAELIQLMNVGAQVGANFASVFTKTTKDSAGKSSTSFSMDAFRNAQGGFDTGSAIAGGYSAAQTGIAAYGAINQATDVAGRGNRALRGAATGASIGANPALVAATGGLSILVGAGVGALVGALRNPGFEQEMKRISKNFGVNISEELARAIDKQKKAFGGNRDSAEIFNLDKIIAEAGGVNDQNAGKLTDRLRDAFVQLEVGKFSVEQTREVLEKNFGTFADQVVKSKDLASQSFQDLISLNERFGTESESIRQFVESQTGVLGESIASLAGPLVGQVDELSGRMEEASARVQELNDAGRTGTEEYAAAKAQLVALETEHAALVVNSAAEVENLGVITLGAFNASIAAGTDYVTAVDKIGPSLDQLIGLQEDLGVTSENVALQELQHFRERVNANKTLVTATKSLGETMRALASIGGLNTDTLEAMERQGLQTFQRLTAAGFSERESLVQMKDFLLNVIQAHEQLGTPIDENTQKLIDQAQEMNLLEGGAKDTAQIMEQGFDKVTGAVGLLVQALGHDVPDSIQDSIAALNKVPKSVDNITSAIDRIPTDIDIRARVSYEDPGLPSGEPSGGSHADGTHGLRNFGSGQLAMLHGWEAVVPSDEYRAMMDAVQSDAIGGGVSRSSSIVVHIDARGALIGDYESQRRLRQLFDDAFMNHVELKGHVGVVGRR